MSTERDPSLNPIVFCARCGTRIEQEGARDLQARIDSGERVVCPPCAPKEACRPGSGWVVAPSARCARGYDPDVPVRRKTPLTHLMAGIGLATATALTVILIWFLVRAAVQHPYAKHNQPPAATPQR